MRLSRTDPANSAISWSTVATDWVRTDGVHSSRRTPSKRISPSQGVYRPLTSLATVDLPEPEPPTSATRWPGLSESEKSAIKGSATRL
ncbi:hypothetical protein D3C86_1725590 [compost metagenome]